ncbi:hypothetical protein [Ectothiorhodospira lacustris]|uniref:hypothetical protein n=1 Tax=Ectothiorhodospira lacustris TaxID=2899127 RepID=UPI001EE7F618|nr:hypothetical protein [Ectothiorhodospira lacustris]MCG5500001.1 hypothetical protein [Ectothiorhodospira lacustris]
MPAFCAVLAGALFMVSTATADVLVMPSGEPRVVQQPEQPARGMHKNTVLHRHGEPEVRHPTVGAPPITRWDYDGFAVVFEGHHVIHTVVRGSRTDALHP